MYILNILNVFSDLLKLVFKNSSPIYNVYLIINVCIYVMYCMFNILYLQYNVTTYIIYNIIIHNL